MNTLNFALLESLIPTFRDEELLDLSDKNIDNIEEGVFNGLNNLKFIYLDKNNITTITPGIFNGLKKLIFLKLDNNRISTLETGCFDELDHLQELFLSHNAITTFEPNIFVNLHKLEALHLDFNQITEPYIINDNLGLINLSNNQITIFRKNIFDNLPHLLDLDLAYNQITILELPIFDKLSNLEILNLRFNQIIKLNPTIFNTLSNLQVLSLQKNFIIMPLIIDINGKKFNIIDQFRQEIERIINPIINDRIEDFFEAIQDFNQLMLLKEILREKHITIQNIYTGDNPIIKLLLLRVQIFMSFANNQTELFNLYDLSIQELKKKYKGLSKMQTLTKSEENLGYLASINPNPNQLDNVISYFNKYIKYKNKYLKLKKSIK